jgi:selenocysteine lyase/cysteine desulfurase
MSLDRKTFLRHAALGSAGFASATWLRAAAGEAVPRQALPAYDAAEPEKFWRAVQAEYSLAPGFNYFNTGGLGPTPRRVLDVAAETTRELQLKSEHGHERLAPARAVVAGFLGAEPAEIAFVRNATEGNAIVAAGLKLAPGDEVIFESHAHPGGSFPWLNQAKLRGIVVKLFEPDAHDFAGNVGRIAALLTPRTRVVQVSHVTAPTGLVMPVAAIARLCRERSIWFHIDGAQSAGMFPFSLRDLHCDSFATSGHKWLGGPLETGVLFVRRDRLDDVAAVLVGAYSGEAPFLPGDFALNSTAMRYEYGTRDSAAVVALAAAMKFQEAIGRERIATRGRQLAAHVRAGLARLPGVEILTPEASAVSSAMISFKCAAVPYDKLFERLLQAHAIRCRPVSEQRLNALRVSTHVFNTLDQCDALIAAVAGILRQP